MEEFISSIGLKSGEKNTDPQLKTGNNWKDVDWFLHTWGFLPNDNNAIEKLSNDSKNEIIMLLLDFAWRKLPEEKEHKMVIKIIQDKFKTFKLSDYFKD